MAMDLKELFISYRREPTTLQFVGRLIHDLEQNGFSVWLDTRDIQPGGDWHGAIGIGLTQCRAIVPVMTKEYLNSRHCVNEASIHWGTVRIGYCSTVDGSLSKHTVNVGAWVRNHSSNI